ncbi:hypothetical protein BC829DRAFT_490646 [Chytridium lagenaria]|nr:hypothetical protein BC829DRAFT_490646 [Chytridium lagenaria]
MGKGFAVRGESGIGKTAFIEACKQDLADLNPLIASYNAPNRACLRSFSALGSLVGALFEALNIMKDLAPSMCPASHLGLPGGIARSPTVNPNAHPPSNTSTTASNNLISASYLTGFPESSKPLLPLLNLLFPNFTNLSAATSRNLTGAPARSRHPSNAGNEGQSRGRTPSYVTQMGWGGAGVAVGGGLLNLGFIPETDPSRMRIDQPGLFLALATVVLEVIKYFWGESGYGVLVLVVEDLQWCDEMSLQVLPKLLRAASAVKIPLVVLTTVRDCPYSPTVQS